MPTHKSVAVQNLHLDLSNFRTVKQPDEISAIHALITINPDWFWALLESLLDDGYLPTENILVLQGEDSTFTVKEGNRRIACLKIALGYVDDLEIQIPQNCRDIINALSPDWIKSNQQVPCLIYSNKNEDKVDKLVSLAHATGEKASRDVWTSVARKRYSRDKQGNSEPSLDLLEKYLKHGKNHTDSQAERWAGEYNITILEEAIQRLSPLIGFSNTKELVASYPKKNKDNLEQLMLDIGIEKLSFKVLRDPHNDWSKYGFVITNTQNTSNANVGGPGKKTSNTGSSTGNTGSSTQGSPASGNTGSKSKSKASAYPLNDPRSVKNTLKYFKVNGNGRDKVATLHYEIKKLNIKTHPHAFCFLLRSMFELSAKAYCVDHAAANGPSIKDKNGKDKFLINVLKDIVKHLTNNNQDKNKVKELHSAIAELGKSDGILSVTSMNQLVHNPSFSIQPGDICTLFNNVFPLLKEMNY